MTDGTMPLEGGCACGAVRYRLHEAPYDSGWCHCRICQQLSGSGAMIFTTVRAKALEWTRGADRLGLFRSTPFGERSFCRDCGSPLTIRVRHQPREIDIAGGSLDDREAIAPGFHLFAGEAPSWALPADKLPRFEKLRPDTRGLPRGQVEVSASELESDHDRQSPNPQ